MFVFNLSTGLTQLSEVVNIDTAKPQLLSEVQTQITSLEETTETGDLIHTLTVNALQVFDIMFTKAYLWLLSGTESYSLKY